jgi:hypothetical protein
MNFETVYSRLTRVLLFAGGFAAFWYEVLFEHADRIWIIAGALGMMGVPLARGLETALAKASTPKREEGE